MSDPVEEDIFLVDGIEMSNFVHPAWFEPFKHPPGTKFDHLGLLTNAIQHDQRRLCDHHEKWQSQRGFRLRSEATAVSNVRIGGAIAVSTASRKSRRSSSSR